jgi:hypothetical protein
MCTIQHKQFICAETFLLYFLFKNICATLLGIIASYHISIVDVKYSTVSNMALLF